MTDTGLPLFFLYLQDFVGALLMIALSLGALFYARRLTRLEPQCVLWTYLLWLSVALAAFSISRSIGHVLRFILIWSGHQEVWTRLAPFSGGINSLIFAAAAALTFYYHAMHAIISRVRTDAEALRNANENLLAAHEALHLLNHTLEERVEARSRELLLSEQKFRHLFEGSKDMIFFCDANGRISDINAAGVDLLGATDKKEIVGRRLADFFAAPELWQRYCAALSSHGHVKDFEIDIRRADGTIRSIMLTASAILDENGAVQGCEGIGKDLTHFKQVTNQLILSEKMASVGHLAAGVAHEINTPLGIILGYCQLLIEDLADHKEALPILKIMEKQTKSCKRIVADLLKFSRHTAEEHRAPTDVNQCVREVVSIMDHTLEMDNITLSPFLDENLPPVVLDAEKFRQVLVNLITNAQHAINKDGLIAIWSKRRGGDTVEIIVADNGTGIAPEIINKIFDPFFTTKGVGKGTGMGLAVSFGIVKDHGGDLQVSSPPCDPQCREAGMRTAFHILLPAAAPEG